MLNRWLTFSFTCCNRADAVRICPRGGSIRRPGSSSESRTDCTVSPKTPVGWRESTHAALVLPRRQHGGRANVRNVPSVSSWLDYTLAEISRHKQAWDHTSSFFFFTSRNEMALFFTKVRFHLFSLWMWVSHSRCFSNCLLLVIKETFFFLIDLLWSYVVSAGRSTQNVFSFIQEN